MKLQRKGESGFVIAAIVAVCLAQPWHSWASQNVTFDRVSAFDGVALNQVCVAPGGDVYVVTSAGALFRSTNHGDSWTQQCATMPGGVTTILPSVFPGKLYGTAYDTLMFSLNYGQTWQGISFLSIGYMRNGLGINHLSAIADTLFLAMDDTIAFRSANGGEGWEAILVGAGAKTFSVREGAATFFASGIWGGTYRSLDRGRTWNNVDFGCFDVCRPFEEGTAHSLLWGPNSTPIFADVTYYEDFGSFVGRKLASSSDNGATWVKLPSAGDFYTRTGSGRLFAYDSTAKIVSYTDNGSIWSQASGLQSIGSMVYDSKENLFAGAFPGEGRFVATSRDSGKTWTLIADTLQGIARIELSIDSSDYLFAYERWNQYSSNPDKGLYRSKIPTSAQATGARVRNVPDIVASPTVVRGFEWFGVDGRRLTPKDAATRGARVIGIVRTEGNRTALRFFSVNK